MKKNQFRKVEKMVYDEDELEYEESDDEEDIEEDY